MSSLRVLTYNTQCRSWGMEAGAQGSLFPVTSTEERARAISRRIKNSYRTWDVVCLQEVFDEDARDVFIDELNAEFPHQVRKCDVDELGLQLGVGAGAAVAFAVPGIGWLAAIGVAVGAIATLIDSKYEDSGLMILSRLPFAQDPIPSALAAMLQDVAPSLTTVPRVAFIPFEDSTDADASAAKGVVYAAIQRRDGGVLHLLNSHTQADPTDDVGKNAETRRKQLDQVLGLIDQFASSSDEVLFVGDLNIDGTHRSGGPRQEWKDRFDTGGSRWHDEFIDAWYREQCPGDITFTGVPLPSHFDRGATAGDQRLDYLIRSIPPFEGRLIAQHMAIPYEVANDPNGPSMYTSDHLPLSIDLHAKHPRGTPMLAEEIQFADPPPWPPADPEVTGNLEFGQMEWFRIDREGAYGFRFEPDGPVAYEVYTADNLSVPHRPFSLLTDPVPREMPFGTRYALPSAPFYIRVFLTTRESGGFYRLIVHRFLGTGEADAIPLLRGNLQFFRPRDGAPHSLDLGGTAWDEHDTVWFIAPFDTRPDESLIATSTITVKSVSGMFDLLVASQEPGELRDLVAHEGGGDEVIAVHEYRRPATGFFLVQRRPEASFEPHGFSILLESDVTYLYARPSVVPGALAAPPSRATRPAELFCIDETDGTFGNEWGSDDIQVNVTSNGDHLVHVPHSDKLAFDDDSERELPQLDGVRYVGGAEFELVELDDFSPVDRASVHLPSFAEIKANPSLIVDPGNGSTLRAKFRIVFDEDDDDGIYELSVDVSQEPPPQ